MFDDGPNMESAVPKSCSEGADSEFILLVAPVWRRRLTAVLAVLEAAGAEVACVDREHGIVEGRVQAGRLEALSGLAQVASLAWRPAGKGACGTNGPSPAIECGQCHAIWVS